MSPDSKEAVDANMMIQLFEVTKAVMKVIKEFCFSSKSFDLSADYRDYPPLR